jgi:peptidoglycan/LPS O-acetylase OafA/YrhL
MRKLIVRALAILAVPFVLGGLAAMVVGLAVGGSGALWVFLFGLLALLIGGLCAVSALIVARPTSGWPRLARRIALFVLGLLCIVVASFRFDISEPYAPLLLLAGVAALALLVIDIREAGGEANDQAQ